MFPIFLTSRMQVHLHLLSLLHLLHQHQYQQQTTTTIQFMNQKAQILRCFLVRLRKSTVLNHQQHERYLLIVSCLFFYHISSFIQCCFIFECKFHYFIMLISNNIIDCIVLLYLTLNNITYTAYKTLTTIFSNLCIIVYIIILHVVVLVIEYVHRK